MPRGNNNEPDKSYSYRVFMPSEAEVWARAAEIRAGWSDEVADKRAGRHAPAPVELRPIKMSVEDRKRLPA